MNEGKLNTETKKKHNEAEETVFFLLFILILSL